MNNERLLLRAALRIATLLSSPTRPIYVFYGRGGGLEPRVHLITPDTYSALECMRARGRRFRLLALFGGIK